MCRQRVQNVCNRGFRHDSRSNEEWDDGSVDDAIEPDELDDFCVWEGFGVLKNERRCSEYCTSVKVRIIEIYVVAGPTNLAQATWILQGEVGFNHQPPTPAQRWKECLISILRLLREFKRDLS